MFSAPYAADDDVLAKLLLAARPTPDEERAAARIATRLIEAIRVSAGGIGSIEDLLREYSLTTDEGLALMVLAEALLLTALLEALFVPEVARRTSHGQTGQTLGQP